MEEIKDYGRENLINVGVWFSKIAKLTLLNHSPFRLEGCSSVRCTVVVMFKMAMLG